MPEPVVVTSDNLDEYNAKGLGLEPENKPEAEEKPAIDVKPEEEIKAEDDKKKGKLEKRFSKLTQERHDAEEKARLAEEKAAKLAQELEEARNPKPKQPDADRPRRDQFQSDDDYVDAMADWKYTKLEAKRKEEESAARIRESVDARKRTFQERQKAFEKEQPDFEEAIAAMDDMPVYTVVLEAMEESPIGPQILYHLSQNPDIVETWKGLTPAKALTALGKLEAKLEIKEEQKPKPEKSTAPAPITPIKGHATPDNLITSNGEFKGTYQQFKEMVNAGKIK